MPNSKPLLYPGPVERLAGQLQLLPLPLRQPAWRLYALLRRKARNESLGNDIPATTTLLVDAVQRGLSFRIVTLAVKLAQTYTQEQLGRRGAAFRARRAHARESFFLLRRSFRHALGQRVLVPEPTWSLNEANLAGAWRAVCDGSMKAAVSAAAVVVYDERDEVRAEVSVAVPARTAVDVELQACAHALQTLLGLGCTRAVVEVDSLSVIRGMSQKLPLKYCLLEGELWLLAQRFAALEVRLAPRVSTYPADRLAALLSRH